MKIRNRQCPFINEKVKYLMRNRDTLHKLARISGLAVDWKRYSSSREMVKLKLREAERDYIKNEITFMNKQCISKTMRNSLPRKDVSNAVYTRDITSLANDFNKFFITVGVNASFDAKKIANENNVSLTVSNLPSITIHESDEFYFHPMTSHELRKIVFSIEQGTRMGQSPNVSHQRCLTHNSTCDN